ncbi:SchA/CurD [Actinomadura rubrobrunea]|uniref:SchA/CurD n=1 Tax=Actinomadura rubrobrunea TaxID=115335 RepID=A0A9W6UVG9_9ACTN|nr:SchA/CurD-like domain-containing protein [Actinomadura rubrobrunea]GLW63933.1 SchA/CurD [Actinomadura rubrobrunea]
MPYAAITYRVKPGCEDELEKIFADFKRVDTPEMRDENGEPVGRLLGTAVFVKDEFMVRVIHYEGDFAAIARHMARQQGVHNVEQKLAPYLTHRRPASSPEEFKQNFQNALMRCVSQLSVETHPAGS